LELEITTEIETKLERGIKQEKAAMDERKKEDERDPTYFSYYSQYVHQQNMLQVRPFHPPSQPFMSL